MNVADYFSALERGLQQDPRVDLLSEPLLCVISDDYNGLFRCRAVFWDASYLDVYEVVSTELGYPVRIHYAYTYMRERERIFRYDNAPHHPEIATHPHHKHIGPQDRPVPADQPTLSQVLAEIADHLDKAHLEKGQDI